MAPASAAGRQETKTRRGIADVADEIEREDPAEIAFVQRGDQPDHHRPGGHAEQENEERR